MRRRAVPSSVVVTACVVGALATLLPLPAHAHLVNVRFGDFYAGLLHPLTALEHVLPMLAAGLLAGQQGPRGARTVLLVFAPLMFVGAIAGSHLPELAMLPHVNVASFFVLGILVAGAWSLPISMLVVLAALFGTSHGLANGAAATATTAKLGFAGGAAAAALLVIALCAGFVLATERPWARVAIRVVGSWITAIGLMAAASLRPPG